MASLTYFSRPYNPADHEKLILQGLPDDEIIAKLSESYSAKVEKVTLILSTTFIFFQRSPPSFPSLLLTIIYQDD